jgi:hypothetical protein
MRPKVKYEEEISKIGNNEKGEMINNEVRSRRMKERNVLGHKYTCKSDHNKPSKMIHSD